MKKVLVITAIHKDAIRANNQFDGECFQYQLRAGKILSDKLPLLNNAELFNRYALDLAKGYTEWIYTLHQVFLEKGFVEKDLNLFFVTDLSNKRTALFETYHMVCHLHVLKELIAKKQITDVTFLRCDEAFVRAFHSFIAVETKGVWTRSFKKQGLRSLFRLERFALRFFHQLAWIKFFYKNPKITCVQELYFSIFPLHFKENGRDIKYGDLPRENNQKPYYLISLVTDGMHQGLTWFSFLKAFSELKVLQQKDGNVFLLESFVSMRESYCAYWRGVRLLLKKKQLLKESYFFDEIDLTFFICQEIESSFDRLVRFFMYEKAVARLSQKVRIDQLIFILHEFSFGRYLNYLFEKYSSRTHRMGFQHGGPLCRRRIQYLLAKEEASGDLSCMTSVPLPQAVLAEDTFSKECYLQAGYQNVKQMKRIYRMSYLDGITRKNIQENTVLIAGGLHDSAQMFEVLIPYIKKHSECTFYFKVHPKLELQDFEDKKKALGLDHLILAKENLSHYLEWVSEIIVIESSVGYEGYLLNIPVKVLLLEHRITESPLIEMDEAIYQNSLALYHEIKKMGTGTLE